MLEDGFPRCTFSSIRWPLCFVVVGSEEGRVAFAEG